MSRARRRGRSASSAPRSAAPRCTTTRSSRGSGSRTSPSSPISARSRERRWPTGRSPTTTWRRTTTRSRCGSASRATSTGCRRERSSRRRESGISRCRPNPEAYVGGLLAEGASRVGYTAYPQPAAVNSEPYKGRPACNSCGLCSGFGCPINARGDALVSWLNPAVRSGRVRVIERAFAYKDRRRTRAAAARREVRYVNGRGQRRAIGADIVVLGGEPDQHRPAAVDVDERRPPDGLANRSGQVGRNMMFHNFTLAAAVFANDVHPLRQQSNPLQLDDLSGRSPAPRRARSAFPGSRVASSRSAGRCRCSAR